MLNAFLKPRIIEVEPTGPSTAKIVMEPFERGFGHTLGNALRRVLLSSMEGYAPTEVQIAGVVHEYSTMEGVQEDVVDLLLNLKGIVFRLEGRADVLLSLRKQGTGPVTAADFELPHDVTILNPEHVIANLSDDVRVTSVRKTPGRSAALFSTPLSLPFVASAIWSRALVSSSVPTWTVWSSKWRPMVSSSPKMPSVRPPVSSLSSFPSLPLWRVASRWQKQAVQRLLTPC